MPRTRPSQLGLPSGYRRHALDKLNRMIAKAEGERSQQLEAVERLTAAKKSTAQARARLRLVEYRLALLHGSRRWFALGTPPVA
jgi:hypothetical protein